jgi:hypothetical protein
LRLGGYLFKLLILQGVFSDLIPNTYIYMYMYIYSIEGDRGIGYCSTALEVWGVLVLGVRIGQNRA